MSGLITKQQAISLLSDDSFGSNPAVRLELVEMLLRGDDCPYEMLLSETELAAIYYALEELENDNDPTDATQNAVRELRAVVARFPGANR